ncbi:hypothetical protein [Sphingomonas corticis]|uniref:Uncharacterized protein n=1 Tax=Sphingomonas corticis TaxID=2722791 RepID=A0ABX1CMF5_9SPHN|nr:hypothetical protein [Sphingomonas corticis]NJR79170.1 hypothetical protein [Sphingomonas corticis]
MVTLEMMDRRQRGTERPERRPQAAGPERVGRAMMFEVGRTAMAAAAARRGSGVLDPLAAHALISEVDPVAAVRVLALLSGSADSLPFGDVAAALGSRVAARFAVLVLLGSGSVDVATPGYLTDASLIALRRQ